MKKDLLGVEYEVIKKPHINRILRLAFYGEYPYGSEGTQHANCMMMYTKKILGAVLFYQAIVFDLTRLKYVWGDGMAMFLNYSLISPVLHAIVAVNETRESLESLQGMLMWSIPMFDTNDSAIRHLVEKAQEIHKTTLSFKCPKCAKELRGRRLTRYRCAKCNSIFLLGVSPTGVEGSAAIFYGVSTISVEPDR